MRKLVSFILCGLVVLYVLVSPADSKDMGESVCLLQNAPVQCSHFCLAALRPITDGIRGTQDKLDRLESKLLAVENLLSSHTIPLEVFEKRLTLVEGQLQESRTLQDTLTKIYLKIPPHFERIGSRYFYIEHDRKNWTEAVDSCLKKGGNLARFKSDEEYKAISAKLRKNSAYWIRTFEFHKNYIFENKIHNIPFEFSSIENNKFFTICQREQET